MSKTVKLRKGLNIPLLGEAEKVKNSVEQADVFSIKPPDFHGVMPKLDLKAGAKVKAGDVIFHNKYVENVKFCSPISGEITEVVRGAKRRILEIIIKADTNIDYKDLGVKDLNSMSDDEVKNYLLSSGLWPFIKQRPIDIIADPTQTPKAIFISAFDSSPIAPDYDFILHGEDENFQTGIDVLKKLTKGIIHLNVNGDGSPDKVFTNAKGVQINKIYGKHPAGNIGTQIHHIDPLNKGEYIWTINPQDVAIIGRVFNTGKFDLSKVIALTGSEVKTPKYIKTIIGTSIKNIVENNITSDNVRIISGNVLTGDKIKPDGFLGFYANQITVIPEGNQSKFFLTDGWLGSGCSKFSISKTYFSWLMPNKKRKLDTNLNGEIRSFVVTGEMEKVFPFDIYPMQLIKSVMYEDLDEMEALGIYEVAPEDFALCEFVCTSKIDIQEKIRQGLDKVQEEIL
ncbi:MAG TPA: Na(+)-translocating NADH-quinone reductase subunit A [Crocinitomix sp.]|nr:Na(+)-translocating NADH-quinone reductase subunit A [Crocinitomix sp.]